MGGFNKDRAAEWIKDRILGFLADWNILLVHYAGGDRTAWLEIVRRTKAERKILLSHADICQLISAVQATREVPGDIAEFGVAYGGSAKIIASFGGGRILHLFDTFAGLPEPGPLDSPRFCKGSYKCSLESVQQYLSGLPVAFYKGIFPATAGAVGDKKFSFVHLDVDLYESTLEGLKFFYPRMSRGGILISHDYQSSSGVDQAFREFFADKPEPVVGLAGYQCMVTKL